MLKVLMSSSREQDGEMWLHVSVSKWRGKTQELADWPDVRLVKDLFIGTARDAYMVIPKASNHVNLGEVHHIWARIEGDALPDFTQGTGSI